MEYLGVVKKIGEEILTQIKNAVKGYVKFIWNTPNHLARWGAVFVAAPVLILGLPLIPGLPDQAARQLAELVLVCLAFFALAATLFGGKGS